MPVIMIISTRKKKILVHCQDTPTGPVHVCRRFGINISREVSRIRVQRGADYTCRANTGRTSPSHPSLFMLIKLQDKVVGSAEQANQNPCRLFSPDM